jgi:hypothetical protein
MPTDEEADVIYQKAIDALSETIAARTGVTDQQKDLAEEKQKQLSREFIGRAIKNIEQRTAKFQQFIAAMQEVIDAFDTSTTVASIVDLKDLVGKAGLIISAAAPGADFALPAATDRVRAVAKPKPTPAATKRKKPVAKPPVSAAKPVKGAKAKGNKRVTPSRAKARKPGKPAAKARPSASTKATSKAKSPASQNKPPARKPATKKPVLKRAPARNKPVRKAKKPG